MTLDALTRKPRLIVLASTYPRWADDHEPSFVHALARRLVERFDVVAVVPHAPGSARHEILDGVTVSRYRYAPAALETLINDGGMAANLRRSAWKWLLLPSFIFMQWFEAQRFADKHTLVHAHWLIPQGLVARLLGRPTLLTCHGADVFSLRGRFATWLKKRALRTARAVTVVSSAMVEPVKHTWPSATVTVRPMGVDLSGAFTPCEGGMRDVAHLLFVGRLVEKKGLDVLIQAMPLVLQRHPGARLTIVGHGPLDTRLREDVAQRRLESCVHFAGPLKQAQLPALYRAATVFVGPFRSTASGDQEGLGLVMVEALGCGCPVVASDLPATRDVLLGTPGCHMVAPGRPVELAQALVAVLDAPAVAHAAAIDGAHVIRDRFDWENVARAYERLLTGLEGNSS